MVSVRHDVPLLQSELDDMKAYRQKERDETKRRLKAALDDIEADELKYE